MEQFCPISSSRQVTGVEVVRILSTGPGGLAITLVHYDSRGKLQESQIGGGDKSDRRARQSQESQAQIKRDKLSKQVLDVTGELRRYYSPTDKQLDALRRGAQPASGAEAPADADCLTMSGWLKPDDRVTLWIDRVTGLQRRIEVAGATSSQRFTAVSTFAPLVDGPSYVARSVIEIPDLKVQIVTENSGHMRVGLAPSLRARTAAYQATAHLFGIASGKPGFSLSDGFAANGYGAHSPGGYSLGAGLLAEIVLTFMFLMIILGASDRRTAQGFAPIAIGLGLMLIHLVGIPVTNLSVNPARSTGPALLVGGWALQQLWLFWLAPLIGAAVAGILYPLMAEEVDASEVPVRPGVRQPAR